MEVVRLESFFLIKINYQLDHFEVEIPNSLETRYLTQHKKSLSYQLFQEELKIREMSFEYLLLRFPYAIGMDLESNPLLQTINYRETALTSLYEALFPLTFYIEKTELTGAWNYPSFNEGNSPIMMGLENINLRMFF